MQQPLASTRSLRGFATQNLLQCPNRSLDCERQQAAESFKKLRARYPIAVTRNLERAKDWVRAHARGSERYGLVASSKARRLKPHAIDIRVDVDPVQWFLNAREDTPSSYYLEDAAVFTSANGN